MTNGFITIPREVLKFEIFEDMDALGFYTRLKCDLRFREAYIDGVDVGVNSILISKPELAKRTNMTVAKVKRLLKVFQELGGIRCENIKNKYTLITFLDPFLIDSDDKGGKENPPAAAVQAKEIDIEEETSCESSTCETVKASEPERGELNAYGKFYNVYLSAEELNSLKRDFPFTDKVLDKLSAYLYNFSYKSEKNHYAQLYKWLLNERNQDSAFSSFADASSGKKVIQPDPDASYDIVRAEERARKSVPTKIKYKDGRIYDLKKKEYVQ